MSKYQIKQVKKYACTVIAVLFTVVYLFPLYWMVITSFKTKEEIFSAVPTFWPAKFSLEAYITQFTVHDGISMFSYLKNSLIIAVGATLISTVLATFAAYGLARYAMKKKQLLILILTVTQMLPMVMFLAPMLQTFNKLGITGTYASVILFDALFSIPMSIIILRPYFTSVPKELEEAAIVDGCNRFNCFYKVILPNAYPGIFACASFAFMAAWGDLMASMTFLSDGDKLPMTVMMYKSMGRYGVNWNSLMATATMVIIPIIVLFLIMRKSLVSGLTSGSVKG
ncbi:carbohydrate ABC transporter permease [Faecalicatena sp. AGMB00832]|uniref:Carbohydrate ABC transporter permease n=1 Tax=Faecalicatena faecalis TaxID=2726362 RepID=A0ABS6D932_9FIRM|nr:MULTISPECIES: carbohydrate ABC transporter permease [Faecalicatena]MBU3878115.1 carbohydrate ABC transporter permease [Faecalicatena faecalis]MCI6465240.1 carbohydrate ABC transporter permease [Faecalicatena sp.]MDY5620879.1 carbohydrate ABC transporter permease [Lachnospiraceae bacterium]